MQAAWLVCVILACTLGASTCLAEHGAGEVFRILSARDLPQAGGLPPAPQTRFRQRWEKVRQLVHAHGRTLFMEHEV